MSDEASPAPARYRADTGTRTTSGLATGAIIFAAIMMMTIGIFQFIAGLVAVFENELYVTTQNYVLEFDVTAWGWIHMLLGILVGAAGWALIAGRTWARVVAITLAVLSAVANFAFIPYYPFWSLLIIALDVLVIWAVAFHGRDVTSP